MALPPPLRLLSLHRLLPALPDHRPPLRLISLLGGAGTTRTFSASSPRCGENGGGSSGPQLTPRQVQLLRGRRPLSPVERVSRLLPQEALSPELMRLREQNQQHLDGDENSRTPDLRCPQEEGGADTQRPRPSYQHQDQVSSTLPGDRLVAFGELLVAEHRRKGRVEFRKMFQLETGARLQSSWGVIRHEDIAGKPAGGFLRTSRGALIFIRRAALEDYVLYMKRGPAISYPKDAATMLMMMDVTEGDCVLESGSGSGAMTLLLSRAVGSKGSVLSVEVREDHHRRARLNYERWRTAWSLRRGRDWPDNVQFYKADLSAASSLLSGRGLHAVALDMIHPHLVLPAVLPHLHPGAVCAVYLANVTQVVDLLEGLRCSALPFLCERIMEVPVRDWVVAPARQKDGQYCTRKSPTLNEGETDEEELAADGDTGPAFGSIPYIARPLPEQMSHTAFLIKLRKFVR